MNSCELRTTCTLFIRGYFLATYKIHRQRFFRSVSWIVWTGDLGFAEIFTRTLQIFEEMLFLHHWWLELGICLQNTMDLLLLNTKAGASSCHFGLFQDFFINFLWLSQELEKSSRWFKVTHWGKFHFFILLRYTRSIWYSFEDGPFFLLKGIVEILFRIQTWSVLYFISLMCFFPYLLLSIISGKKVVHNTNVNAWTYLVT